MTVSPLPCSDALDAIRGGDTERLRRLLAEHPALAQVAGDGDRPDEEPSTLLQQVAGGATDVVETARVAMASALLAAGADPGGRPTTGPLALAALSGHPELTSLLANACAARGDEVLTSTEILYRVLFHGRVAAGLLLVDHGVPLDFPTAAALGRFDTARSFLAEDRHLRPGAHKIDAAVSDAPRDAAEERQCFDCAYLYAAICGQVKAIDRLLIDRVDIDVQPPGSDFGGVGATALHWAAGRGQAEVVDYLLGRGADPCRRDDGHHATPLGWALDAEQSAVIEVFRRHRSRLCEADRFALA